MTEAVMTNGRALTIWPLTQRQPTAKPSTIGSAFLNRFRYWRGGLGTPTSSLGSGNRDWPARLPCMPEPPTCSELLMLTNPPPPEADSPVHAVLTARRYAWIVPGTLRLSPPQFGGLTLKAAAVAGAARAQISDSEVWRWRRTGFMVMSGDSR
jgi:hypothetical protein